MAFTENLEQFFETTEFAVIATFTRSDSVEFDADVIFDATSDREAMFDANIESDTPQLLVRTSEISAIVRGNTVEIDSVAYTIERIRKNGDVSVCYLRT